MGIGIGGGGFGVRGGVNASSRGIGAGVGAGPLSATSGCGLSTLVWLIGVIVVFLIAIYLVPILIALAAGGFLLIALRDMRQGRGSSPGLAIGLAITMLVSGGLGIWLWADTIGNWRHSTKVPETSAMTADKAEESLRAAGFTNIQFDLGQPSATLDLSKCEVSDTNPGHFLDVDNRDPIVIEGWCSDDAAIPAPTPTPTPVPVVPDVADTPWPSTRPVDPTDFLCEAFVGFNQSNEFQEALEVAKNPDDRATLMEAFDAMYTRGQPLVAALPSDAPPAVRRALQGFFRDVKSIAESGTKSGKDVSLEPFLKYVESVCQ